MILYGAKKEYNFDNFFGPDKINDQIRENPNDLKNVINYFRGEQNTMKEMMKMAKISNGKRKKNDKNGKIKFKKSFKM